MITKQRPSAVTDGKDGDGGVGGTASGEDDETVFEQAEGLGAVV
jgi:hypothetical protein